MKIITASSVWRGGHAYKKLSSDEWTSDSQKWDEPSAGLARRRLRHRKIDNGSSLILIHAVAMIPHGGVLPRIVEAITEHTQWAKRVR